MFVDPWESYVQRLQQEVQNQKRNEDWIEILNKDHRQRGCEDVLCVETEFYSQNSELGDSYTSYSNESSQANPSDNCCSIETHPQGDFSNDTTNFHPVSPLLSPSPNVNNLCEDHIFQGPMEIDNSVSTFGYCTCLNV